MRPFWKNIWFWYIVLVFAKIILGLFVPAPTAHFDEYAHLKLASDIAQEGSYTVHGVENYKIMPLYPLIISLAFIFQDAAIIYIIIKIINALLITTAIFPLYFIAKDFLTKRKAMAIATVGAFLPALTIFSFLVMSENLFYPLFLWSMYFLYKAFKEHHWKWFLLGGLSLGLTYDTRFLGVVLVPVCLLLYLFWQRKETSFKHVILYYAAALIVVLPIIVRKVLVFGFTFESLLGYGGAAGRASRISSNVLTNLGPFGNWIILYIGYIILASGVLFGIYYLCNLKQQDKRLRTLFGIASLTAIFNVLLAAAFSSQPITQYASPFMFFTHHPVGRYVEALIPFIILLGFIMYEQGTPKKKLFTGTIIASVIALVATQLTIGPLFPSTNTSLSYLGFFQYILEYLLLQKTTVTVAFHWLSFIIIALVLVVVPYLFYKLRKKTFLVPLLLIFLILNTFLATGMVMYNSNVYWNNGDQTQFGKWINKNIKEEAVFLIDARDKGKITKLNQEGLYYDTPADDINTVIGFWINNPLRVGDVTQLTGIDYVLTTHTLELELIQQSENGIYLYRVS